VRAAEQALIEFEIAVETFRVEVENFSRLHHQKLGPMYSRLDELDAQIAEARAASTGNPRTCARRTEARARVMPMPGIEELFHDWLDSDGLSPEAEAMLTDQPVRPPQRVRPSDEARKLYRELVRKAHPDLAQDDTERARRDEFISRVNAAYGRGDEPLLRELSEEWAAGPVAEERRPSRSEELYARLEWLAQRKELLALVARDLEESAIGAMLKMAPDDPDRLLEEIAEQLLAQVSEREAERRACSAAGLRAGFRCSVLGTVAVRVHRGELRKARRVASGHEFRSWCAHGRGRDLADGDFLLDVREDDEWQAGHAEGALHIPISDFVARYGELTEAAPQDGRVHVICRSGGRSAQVAMYLVQQGIDAVNVDGGMQVWAAAGRPVVNGRRGSRGSCFSRPDPGRPGFPAARPSCRKVSPQPKGCAASRSPNASSCAAAGPSESSRCLAQAWYRCRG
jgi:rhodanese-related sulfurtransferase